MIPPTLEELTPEVEIKNYPICPECLADLKDGYCDYCGWNKNK